MEVVLILAGFLIGHAVTILLMLKTVKNDRIGKLRIVWDYEEHQPYMFMELSNPDIASIARRKQVILDVDDEFEHSQK